MKKTIAALLLFLTSAGALAAAPQTGTWWSPSESGRGYAIDVQGSTLVMTSYAYGIDGRMQWYYADGPLINGGARWTGTLYKFDFGQPLNGAYLAPINTGNDGTVAIDVTSRSAGVLTLPGGRRVNIERYNFGVGSPPQSLWERACLHLQLASASPRCGFSRAASEGSSCSAQAPCSRSCAP